MRTCRCRPALSALLESATEANLTLVVIPEKIALDALEILKHSEHRKPKDVQAAAREFLQTTKPDVLKTMSSKVLAQAVGCEI